MLWYNSNMAEKNKVVKFHRQIHINIAGIICFYFIPSIIPATNVVVAIIIGASSGLTATGTNQIFKQFNKDKENNSC